MSSPEPRPADVRAKERPAPAPGGALELGFLGAVLHASLPHGADALQPTPSITHDAGVIHVRPP
jgi:hypothetical protein